MANFENTSADLGKALNEATNGTSASDNTGPVRDEEKYKQAREAGWVAPQAYNYEAATAKHGDEPASSSGEQVDDSDAPCWAHEAAKYEWQDDFGDVGPEVPELEAQLFKGDTRTKIGQHLEK